MLTSLYVKNFALIDDLEIHFLKGLCALTGETGAGKSIILESLQMLFGKRSDQTMIRHQENKASIKGIFKINKHVMSRFDLPELLTIEREIDRNGRHMIRINDEGVTQSRLKDITNSIGLIHAQNDTMTLYDPDAYLEFVDQIDDDNITQTHHEYLLNRSSYLDQKSKLEALSKKKDQAVEKKSYLEYQIEELKSYHLKKDEKNLLDEQIEKLKNHDKIMTQLQQSYQFLSNQACDIDFLYQAGKALDKIGSLDKAYADMAQRLIASYYDLDDVQSNLMNTMKNLDFDQPLFDQMQERSYQLDKLEKKYQKTIDELIFYQEEIENELLMITDYDQFIENLKNQLNVLYQKALASGQRLTKRRQENALKLSKSILNELKELDLDKASFEIVFENHQNPPQLLETGLDQIDFLISLNEGEPIKPLSKVASGGERARFMFAIRSIYAQNNELSLLILDEIDIGVSGRTAAKVAQKMLMLSKMMQVIVITHLPQVAAKADHHFGIIKIKEKDRMVTRIFQLDKEQRIEMIAMMLSDEKLTHYAIEQAKLLLEK